MPSFCSYTDASMIYEDFTTMVGTGTDCTNIIAAASDWVNAILLDFYGTVFYESGTIYPYWIKQATALKSVYIAFSRRQDQAQTTNTGFWTKYEDEALKILQDLRDGSHNLSSQETAPWERGITPAKGVLNGSVVAPAYGAMFSNFDVPGLYYTGEYPRVYVVELDGTGSTIAEQTFRWKYKYGSEWEAEKQALSWEWVNLSGNVAIRFEDSITFAVGQMWEVACTPPQTNPNFGVNGMSHSLTLV